MTIVLSITWSSSASTSESPAFAQFRGGVSPPDPRRVRKHSAGWASRVTLSAVVLPAPGRSLHDHQRTLAGQGADDGGLGRVYADQAAAVQTYPRAGLFTTDREAPDDLVLHREHMPRDQGANVLGNFLRCKQPNAASGGSSWRKWAVGSQSAMVRRDTRGSNGPGSGPPAGEGAESEAD